MRDAVLAETSLSLSIGGGTSKLVAKLAAGLAKPRPGAAADGVYVVAPGAEADFMLQFALADIPLIGPKAQERLARFGLRTVRDVVRHDRETLVGWLGEREGSWLYQRARGIDRAPVEANREAKSVSRDETFATDLDDDGALAAQLLSLAARASADGPESGLSGARRRAGALATSLPGPPRPCSRHPASPTESHHPAPCRRTPLSRP